MEEFGSVHGVNDAVIIRLTIENSLRLTTHPQREDIEYEIFFNQALRSLPIFTVERKILDCFGGQNHACLVRTRNFNLSSYSVLCFAL